MEKAKTVRMSMQDVYEQTGFCEVEKSDADMRVNALEQTLDLLLENPASCI